MNTGNRALYNEPMKPMTVPIPTELRNRLDEITAEARRQTGGDFSRADVVRVMLATVLEDFATPHEAAQFVIKVVEGMVPMARK
ncbi:MAG: hypothetical protein ABFE07_24245 [Armatimonadia bacterium]